MGRAASDVPIKKDPVPPGSDRFSLALQVMDKAELIKALQKDLAVVRSIRTELKALEAREEQGYSMLDCQRMHRLETLARQSHEQLLEAYYDETAW